MMSIFWPALLKLCSTIALEQGSASAGTRSCGLFMLELLALSLFCATSILGTVSFCVGFGCWCRWAEVLFLG
jgi:hypothetical protein